MAQNIVGIADFRSLPRAGEVVGGKGSSGIQNPEALPLGGQGELSVEANKSEAGRILTRHQEGCRQLGRVGGSKRMAGQQG